MNPRALDRLNREQLLFLHQLAQRYAAWCETAHHLRRLGMSAHYALLQARSLRAQIAMVTS